ncbi:alpha/beta fold hydrolase [Sphingomonas bacterium]|uniref:alpha/beta hydrolase family protein n=1 Tax=Sphingomonas bacterium TaxID=1895847 RepID=UPI00260FFE86|nr:alpha/beta fold hydrolase [Sphingomonas bacterium]MDB5678252.1 peptidase prolyl oligopeptidase active site domain protein [Sphingomonas bacterium]
MRYLGKALVALATVAMAGGAIAGRPADAPAATSPAETAKAFGARENIQQISLSPSGDKVAMLMPTPGRGMTLYVVNLTTDAPPKPIMKSSGDIDQLRDCRWSTDTRLICSISLTDNEGTVRLGYSRTIALNDDGSKAKVLSARTSSMALGITQDGGSLVDWGADGTGSVLMTHFYVPEYSTGTHAAETRSGLGVDLVDTTTLSRKAIEQPRENVVAYISDGQGVVRMMGIQSTDGNGYDGNRISYSYRQPNSRDWKPFGTVRLNGNVYSGFVPEAVDRELNVAYGFESTDGRAALYSVSLDGSMTKKLVMSRPDVDMDSLISVGRRDRVVGASYVTDRREVMFFDPALKALQASLAKALPGHIITFIDASADENKLLLFAGSDNDPGRYYLFDKKTRSLSEILAARSELAGMPLSTVKAITYKAADGTTIPAYLTLPAGSDGKNLPAIVMPHGGPAARDEWGFDWLSQFFAARGYAVIQPEFRGSAGYGDQWYNKNGYQGWRTAMSDINDAGHWMVKSGIADPQKLAIVGWSYGGYAALQTSVVDPDLYKAIVAVAPVTDLDTLRDEARAYSYYPQRDAQIGHGPWVVEGSPARNASRIKAPVLLFHGDRDTNVGIGESRLMAGKLKSAGAKVELVEYKGLDHQLDDDVARAGMLAKADAFLRASMGMAP